MQAVSKLKRLFYHYGTLSYFCFPMSFINSFIRKPPALFPWVALFHIGMLAFSIWTAAALPLSPIWIDVAWMLLYTISWVFICNMKRWAAWMYLGLTILDLSCWLAFHKDPVKQDYASSLVMIDVLFSFFILVYYKKFS